MLNLVSLCPVFLGERRAMLRECFKESVHIPTDNSYLSLRKLVHATVTQANKKSFNFPHVHQLGYAFADT